MGRPRKSDAEKAARGTLQPSRTLSARHKNMLSSDATLIATEPPSGLTKDARDAWQIAIAFTPKGLLTPTDAPILERWCRNYALYRKYQKRLESSITDLILVTETSTGAKKEYINPLFTVLDQIEKRLVMLEKELGFTPASRTRVRVQVPEEEEIDEFSNF